MTDPDALARFEREARAIAALSHPNIVALHDVGRDNGAAFAVMELLDGESLDRRLATADLPWRTALHIAAAVADGLSSAHARGIVHRDLKPGNIFIVRDGLVKIVDFGLATDAAFQRASGGVATGDRARRDFRNGRIHVARTGARRACGSPERYLLARLRALRDACARASVPWRHGSRSVCRDPQRSAARSGGTRPRDPGARRSARAALSGEESGSPLSVRT